MNEALNAVWMVVVGGLIVPLVNWIKMKLPSDFPVQSVVISAILSFAAMYGLAQILQPDLPLMDIITYALGANFTAQVTHAGVKSAKKLNGGTNV